jgi:hypothetical protein
LNKKLDEIELFKFKNPIFEIIEFESEKYKDEEYYMPPIIELTNINWNLRGLVYNITSKPEEFYNYYTNYDVLVIYEFYLYYLLSNFKGIYTKKGK